MEYPNHHQSIITRDMVSSAPIQQNYYQGIPSISIPMIRVLLNGEYVEIPSVLLEDDELIHSVLTSQVFNSLSAESKNHLVNLLPKVKNMSIEGMLEGIFAGKRSLNSSFPMEKIRHKLNNLTYSAEKLNEITQLRDNRKVIYDHFIRHYNITMLKKLLISRHELLAKVSETPLSEDYTNKLGCMLYKRTLKNRHARDEKIQKRAAKRARVMLNEIKKQVSESNFISSDEENDIDKSTSLLPSPAGSAKSTIYDRTTKDYDLHQSTETETIKSMLRTYRNLRETEPDAPSLDIDDCTLEEVYNRAGLSYQSERNFAQQNKIRLQLKQQPKVYDMNAIEILPGSESLL
uniref:Coiled-coil domain-containing protein n=1 Tax=Rhabditophanes sp. KR3021 TaxID=114890 RepID=A0AC35TQ91_9BILA